MHETTVGRARQNFTDGSGGSLAMLRRADGNVDYWDGER
jgi:hypothetical protein